MPSHFSLKKTRWLADEPNKWSEPSLDVFKTQIKGGASLGAKNSYWKKLSDKCAAKCWLNINEDLLKLDQV